MRLAEINCAKVYLSLSAVYSLLLIANHMVNEQEWFIARPVLLTVGLFYQAVLIDLKKKTINLTIIKLTINVVFLIMETKKNFK